MICACIMVAMYVRIVCVYRIVTVLAYDLCLYYGSDVRTYCLCVSYSDSTGISSMHMYVLVTICVYLMRSDGTEKPTSVHVFFW